MSRTAGVCPVPMDWTFKTSSRYERRMMIENAYLSYERQQKEAAEWQAYISAEFQGYQNRQIDKERPEKKRRAPPTGASSSAVKVSSR